MDPIDKSVADVEQGFGIGDNVNVSTTSVRVKIIVSKIGNFIHTTSTIISAVCSKIFTLMLL